MPTQLDNSTAETPALTKPINADEEDCADWGPAPEEVPANEDETGESLSCRELAVLVGAMCLSIPAIIGAWCWPMVLAAVLNIGASVMNGGAGTGAVDFFHGFQVAIMLTIMFNLVQFIFWRCKQSRRGNCWQVHRPTFLMLLSAIMTNFQPMAILACGSWKMICCPCEAVGGPAQCTETGRSMPPWPNAKNSDGSQAYRQCHGNGNWFWAEDHCYGDELALFPNKASGWVIQIVLTWGGFVVMFMAVSEAMQLGKKIKNKWRQIRSGR